MLMYYVGALLCATSKLNYKWKRKSDFLYVFDPNKCMFLFGGGLNKFVDKCRPPWFGDTRSSISPKTTLLGGL